jgi:hypothetical protein
MENGAARKQSSLHSLPLRGRVGGEGGEARMKRKSLGRAADCRLPRGRDIQRMAAQCRLC